MYIKKISYNEFLKNTKTQDAVVRNLEIIGEAAKNTSSKLKKDCPQIPWKKLAGIRDRLIHHYFGVNYDIVWAIVKEELPKILPEIKQKQSQKQAGMAKQHHKAPSAQKNRLFL